MSKYYTIRVGRDSETGEFIPVDEARRRPNTTEVERIKIPREKDNS
jgi:hypothetical protein